MYAAETVHAKLETLEIDIKNKSVKLNGEDLERCLKLMVSIDANKDELTFMLQTFSSITENPQRTITIVSKGKYFIPPPLSCHKVRKRGETSAK